MTAVLYRKQQQQQQKSKGQVHYCLQVMIAEHFITMATEAQTRKNRLKF